jgi:hypothetical protein
MILTAIDFDVETERKVPAAVGRAFRLKINPVVDSISLRIPKKSRTDAFHRLNVVAHEQADVEQRYWAVEGVGMVELRVPGIGAIYRASRPRAAERVIELLKVGVEVAAKHDKLFAANIALWRQLIATAREEFDWDLGIARSHRTRRWRAETVLRITPTRYHYDLVVRDSRTGDTRERHRIKSTECALPFYEGVGFSKVHWDGQEIAVLTKEGKEVFRVVTKLPA